MIRVKLVFLLLLIFSILSFLNTCYVQTVYAHKEDYSIYPINFQIQMLSWEEVKKLIPKNTVFQVIDFETGQSFNVQRRAGTKHADVQPLTKEDTKIMKGIYGGKWSWKRRAILVLINGRLIAASMHGMPHGAGAIRNNFPGHFCIHFYQSTTHRTKELDLAHHIMIYKAAGKLDEYLQSASPYELIDIFLVAVNQSELDLLKKIMDEPQQVEEILKAAKNVTSIKRISSFPEDNTTNLLAVRIPLKVELYIEGEGKEKRELDIVVKRNALTSMWKIALTQISAEF